MPEKTRAAMGGCQRFECRVIGYPRPTIQWFKDGRNITNDERYEFDYSIDGIITMVICNVTEKDQGVYSCRAENSEGWAATAAFLNVRVVDERVEHELLSVHQMKFEIGGLYDKDDDDQVPIDAQIDSFIDQITGKDGRFSISSAIEGIENQKNEKGRDGLNDEISHGRDIILAKVEAQNDDSGIGLDPDKSRMSSTEEVPDEADGQECVMADSGRKELVDGEFLDKAKVYGEKEPPATAQPKRRMSDLDVHLKMMNDKSSRFFST